jgi:hypothetical protein
MANCYVSITGTSRISWNLVQEAIFSFTVLRARIHNPQTLDMVKVVGELVTQAQFLRANRELSDQVLLNAVPCNHRLGTVHASFFHLSQD